MGEFNAAHALEEAKERNEQLAEGTKLVPIMAAVIAVFAALATLFANHSSISGLAAKTEAILASSKATDTWNYYQAKRLKIEVNRAMMLSGTVSNAKGLAAMQKTVAGEDRKSHALLVQGQQLDKESEDHYAASERFMQSYEKYEVSATLFEVSVVLVSLTALMRTKIMLFVAVGATIVGIAFFAQGWFLH